MTAVGVRSRRDRTMKRVELRTGLELGQLAAKLAEPARSTSSSCVCSDLLRRPRRRAAPSSSFGATAYCCDHVGGAHRAAAQACEAQQSPRMSMTSCCGEHSQCRSCHAGRVSCSNLRMLRRRDHDDATSGRDAPEPLIRAGSGSAQRVELADGAAQLARPAAGPLRLVARRRAAARPASSSSLTSRRPAASARAESCPVCAAWSSSARSRRSPPVAGSVAAVELLATACSFSESSACSASRCCGTPRVSGPASWLEDLAGRGSPRGSCPRSARR